MRVRIKAAHRHWNQAGTETSPQKGPETFHTFTDLKLQRCNSRVLSDTDVGRRDLEFVITGRGQLQPRVVLVLMVSSTAWK